MSPRPTIFISSVSKELRGARQLVANTLTFLGYEPIWQDIFGMEGGDLRQMLRQKIDQSQGVVQLVGDCYGAEPPVPDPAFGRISYTQYEALYGRKVGKKVWYLFMDETFPKDAHEPEPEDQRQLQAVYRNYLKSDTHLFHPLGTREALETAVLKLRDDLAQLRRGARRWAWGVAAGIIFIACTVILLLRGQGKTQGSLNTIAQRFESLASNGGLIPNAKTPEEHYHNARIYELGGNFTAARKEYSAYIASNLEVLDPWLSYSAMLRSAEGNRGAGEAMRALGSKLTPQTISYQTVLALLADGDERLAQLQALAAQHPEFGPLDWLISQEFSEASRGYQTLSELRSEKEWLEKFRAANSGGRFEKYFLDKKEAQKWIGTADMRWVKVNSTPARVLENPVTLDAEEREEGWNLTFSVSEFHVKKIFYRLDGAGDFLATENQDSPNPISGVREAYQWVDVPKLAAGEHVVEVKYVDLHDRLNGPYLLRFSTAEAIFKHGKSWLETTRRSWVNFYGSADAPTLWFQELNNHRAVLKEIRYSLDNESLDKTFPFAPSDTLFARKVDDVVHIDVPRETRFACVQLTYKDGTKSTVEKFARKK